MTRQANHAALLSVRWNPHLQVAPQYLCCEVTAERRGDKVDLERSGQAQSFTMEVGAAQNGYREYRVSGGPSVLTWKSSTCHDQSLTVPRARRYRYRVRLPRVFNTRA